MFRGGVRRIESYNHRMGNGGLEMTHCGYEKCVPDFVCHPHIRDCYLLHCVIGGKGVFVQDGRERIVGPGEAFLIYPGSVVSYWGLDPNDPWVFCWFGFVGPEAESLTEAVGLSKDNPAIRLRTELQAKLQTAIGTCADEMHGAERLSNTLVRSYLYQMLYLLELNAENPGAAARDRASDLFREALAFIEHNYSKPIAVSDIYAHLRVDRSYGWRIFQQHAGKSPQQYLMEYRIDKAAQLLARSGLTLGEAAQSVGIPDQYYFSRLFKKLKGTAPSRFAAQLQDASIPAAAPGSGEL